MGSLLAYALTAIAAQGCYNLAFSKPVFSIGTFLAAFVAVLIEIDYSAMPPFKTPILHSVTSAIVLSFAAGLTCSFFRADWYLYAAAFFIGYLSHLCYDVAFEFVFIVPLNLNIRKWFVPLPEKATKSWQCWYRTKMRVKKNMPILNLTVCGGALLVIVVCLLLTQI